MRLVTAALLLLLGLVQAGLWFGDGGLPHVRKMRAQLDAQRQRNDAESVRNERLLAEVEDLKQGLEMIEDRARTELGMIKPDEIFVQVTRR
jgi:cell division protein FtsB